MLELHLNLEPVTESDPLPTAIERDWGIITERIRQGDREAFAEYYQRFFEPMFAEAMRLANLDEATSLDIVQDSMLKVIRSIKRIDNENLLLGWSRAVVRNSVYDWLRKRAREENLVRVFRDNVSETESVPDEQDELQQLAWIESQLLDQPPEIQKLFSLRYRLGWTLKKIGIQLGLKTGAVDGKLNRTIEKMKNKARLEEIE